MTKQTQSSVSIIDLYCGVGGYSLGAARAGFKVIGAVDNDAIAIETHKKNYPNVNHLQTDLSNLPGKELLERLGLKGFQVTGVIGGPPCQGFSTIGKNHTDDRRNYLFVQFYRLVKEIKPKFFVCENVPGLLRNKFDKVRQLAQDNLKRSYVLLPPIVLRASDFGAPTKRTRVFFIGYRKSSGIALCENDFKPPKGIKKVHVKDALKGLPLRINPAWRSHEDGWRKIRSKSNGHFGKRLRGVIPEGVGDPTACLRLRRHNWVSGCIGTYHTEKVLKRWRQLKPGERDEVSRTSRLDPEGFCPTLRAGTDRDKGSYQSLRPVHPTEDRVITPREAARLQGFPDWYIFHETKWHSFRQIGNSVSPLLAERLLRVIFKKL
jgi:DNA (cytosine-5)-methyltransferase 1